MSVAGCDLHGSPGLLPGSASVPLTRSLAGSALLDCTCFRQSRHSPGLRAWAASVVPDYLGSDGRFFGLLVALGVLGRLAAGALLLREQRCPHMADPLLATDE